MVSSTPRPHFTPGKDPVPILQEPEWAPGSVWTGGKSRPHRDSIPDRPALSSVAIPTELPGPIKLIYLSDMSVTIEHLIAKPSSESHCINRRSLRFHKELEGVEEAKG